MARLRSILLTGASGFVGQHLVALLRSSFAGATLHTDYFDVADREEVVRRVRAAKPDACVHLAGITLVPASRRDPDRAWAVNLHGTLNLARAVLREAPECFFVHVSSSDIYGRSFAAGRPADEATVPAPANDYAATKAAADLAVGALAGEGLRAVRLRPFNHTGPGQSPDFVVAAFARQVARIAAGVQPPVIRTGALEPMRDFLDVRDVCAAYGACLARADRLPSGAILNIASGTPRRIGTILADLLGLAGVEAEIVTDADRLRPSDVPLAVGNAGAARRLLGWEPRIGWEQTLADTLRYWNARTGGPGAS